MKRLSDERLDELLRALAHPDRRRFLRACRCEPVSAGDLAETSALALASVSEHLKVLRKTGLLVLEKQGRFRLYRADLTVLQQVTDALKELEDIDGA
jgi:DNA-binding transcriptional ArsR family regulator